MFVIEKSLANLNHVCNKQQNQIISLKKKILFHKTILRKLRETKKTIYEITKKVLKIRENKKLVFNII